MRIADIFDLNDERSREVFESIQMFGDLSPFSVETVKGKPSANQETHPSDSDCGLGHVKDEDLEEENETK